MGSGCSGCAFVTDEELENLQKRRPDYDAAHAKMLELFRVADEFAKQGMFEKAISVITNAEQYTTQLSTHNVKDAHLSAIAISQRRGTYRRMLFQLKEAIEEYQFGLEIGEKKIAQALQAANQPRRNHPPSSQYLLLHLICECSTLEASCHMALLVAVKKIQAIREAKRRNTAESREMARNMMELAPDEVGAFSVGNHGAAGAGGGMSMAVDRVATPGPGRLSRLGAGGGPDGGRASRLDGAHGNPSSGTVAGTGTAGGQFLAVPGTAPAGQTSAKDAKKKLISFVPGADDEILSAGVNSFSFAQSIAMADAAGNDERLTDELAEQLRNDPVTAPMMGLPEAALEIQENLHAKHAEQVLLHAIEVVEDMQDRQCELLLSPLFRLADLYETLGMMDPCMRCVRRLVGIALVKYGHDHEIYLRQNLRLKGLAELREQRKTLMACTMIAKTWRMKAQMKRLRAANARSAYVPRRHVAGKRATAPPDDKSAKETLGQVAVLEPDPPSDRDEEEEEEDDVDYDEFDDIDLNAALEKEMNAAASNKAPNPAFAGTFGALKEQIARMQ